MLKIFQVMCVALLGCTMFGYSSEGNGFQMEVLVNGHPVSEYFQDGTTYIEARAGKEYAIRITNPLGIRVAVALSVDGLNTIDARHTDSYSAKKWVLDPYQSVTISGWQTNSRQARRFFFTTEEKSYGKWLDKTDNLGVISAVFFKEKCYSLVTPSPQPLSSAPAPLQNEKQGADMKSKETESASRLSRDENAATGIGKRMHNDVQWIQMELDRTAAASLNLRYEFRPVLTRLGIFPYEPNDDPLFRRKHARGFKDTGYCPDHD